MKADPPDYMVRALGPERLAKYVAYYNDSVEERLRAAKFSEAAIRHVMKELSFWDADDPDGEYECNSESVVHLVRFRTRGGELVGPLLTPLSASVAERIDPEMILDEGDSISEPLW